MSRRTFTRHFRQLTGATVSQWLLAERLALTQRLLEGTDHPVERIAQLAGMGSPESLRHHFRQALGFRQAPGGRLSRRLSPTISAIIAAFPLSRTHRHHERVPPDPARHPAFAPPAFAQADLKIGVIASSTGVTAVVGMPQKNTVALLPSEIGGQKIEYIVLDDASDPTNAVTNVRSCSANTRSMR